MTIEYTNVEIPRDRWGRPLVMREGTDKRLPYQRTTTFVGCLEPTYNLMAWKQRQTALGMGMRKDLVLAAAACRPDDKKKLNEIAEAATEYALSSAGATIGTAVHALTERIDRGEPLGPVPSEAAADIAAYEKAMTGIEHLAIEQFRVFDAWRVAGTTDRVIHWRGENFLADIKTGSIDYPAKIAMQLAMYAHSLPYDIGSDTRYEQTPNLNMKRALISHLPAGTGECHLVWADIEQGWRGCQIAKQVWEWRAIKDHTFPVGHDDPLPLAAPATWESLILSADSKDRLREIWTRAKECGQLDDDLKAVLTQRSKALGG